MPWESGVLVDFNQVSQARIELQPLELPDSTNSSFAVSAVGTRAGGFLQAQADHYLGFIRLRRGLDYLLLDGRMPYLGTNAQQVRVAVYEAGTLAGMTPILEGEGRLAPIALTGNPRITSVGALANSLQSTPGLSMVFDTNSTFLITNGTDFFSFTGNEVRVLSVGPIYLEFPAVEAWFESVDSVALLSTGVPEFTIVSEQERPRDVPRMSIERVGQQVRLSWLDANRVYDLRTSTVLYPGFSQDGLAVFNTNGMASATATISTNGNLFFRLVHTRAYFD